MDQRRAALLAAVLNQQAEPDPGPRLQAARVAAALTKGPPFDADERLLLWRSPASRRVYMRVRRLLRASLRARWEAAQLQPTVLGLAAAEADSRDWHFHSPDRSLSLTLSREDDPTMPWSVLLTLSQALQRTLPPLTPLRLVDDGGLEWVRRRPDKAGRIAFGWYHPEHSPLERLRQYRCWLDMG